MRTCRRGGVSVNFRYKGKTIILLLAPLRRKVQANNSQHM